MGAVTSCEETEEPGLKGLCPDAEAVIDTDTEQLLYTHVGNVTWIALHGHLSVGADIMSRGLASTLPISSAGISEGVPPPI